MRLLLADDHALFLESLEALLTAHGHRVLGTAMDGLEALDKARALRPDLILMDLAMPRCDGLTATRLIKAELPAITIVALTASEADADLFEAIRCGASGYLLKSMRSPDFVRLLEGFERGEALLSPGLAGKLLAEFAHLAECAVGDPAAQRSPEAELHALTAREIQVLTLLVRGQTYPQIAAALHLSEVTIRYHIGEIMRRLHLKTRAQLIAHAAQLGLCDKSRSAQGG